MISVKSKIRKAFLKASGKFSFIKIGVKCKKVWYGNLYGGFYLNPDLVNENSIVYSFGIGEDISFDMAVISKHQCTFHGFDPTPKSIKWINEQNLPDTFQFHAYGISDKTGFLDFYLPKNTDFVSGSLTVQNQVDQKNKVSVKVKSLEDITEELGHKHIDVLKMDIEGSEFDVIDNILASKLSITQLLIEFHGRFCENGMQKTENAINSLRAHDYEIFAISDSFEEISFVKMDAIKK